MKRVHFSMNYKAAEAYMARMCQKGWAAVRRTGGLWDLRALQAQPVRLPALLSPGAARGGAGLPEAPSGRPGH